MVKKHSELVINFVTDFQNWQNVSRLHLSFFLIKFNFILSILTLDVDKNKGEIIIVELVIWRNLKHVKTMIINFCCWFFLCEWQFVARQLLEFFKYFLSLCTINNFNLENWDKELETSETLKQNGGVFFSFKTLCEFVQNTLHITAFFCNIAYWEEIST